MAASRRPNYPLQRLIITALILCATVATFAAKQSIYESDDDGSGSRRNRLSTQCIQELREAFIGREFVFRHDWRSEQVIYESQLGKPIATAPSSGSVLATAGEVARVTGMNFRNEVEVYLFFETQRGIVGRLAARSKNRSRNNYERLDDDFVDTAWLERLLTQQTIDFLAAGSTAELASLRQRAPRAEAGLQLSENPYGGSNRAIAEVSQFPVYLDSLKAVAEPAILRPGDTVHLIVEYTISGSESQAVIVDESRRLKLGDKPLPGFPVAKSFARIQGDHRSDYQLRIPPGASPGRYSFEAQACANGECISRIVTFEVRR